jgi:diguanylate cyclase (GGDEF)-like protein
MTTPEPHEIDADAPPETSIFPPAGTVADAFVACVVFVLAVAVGFLVNGGRGRYVEFFLVGAAVLAAYLLGWKAGRALAISAIPAYVILEAHYDRLVHDRYWTQVFLAAAIAGAIASAAYLRRDIEKRKERLGLALAEVGELRSQTTLESTLFGSSQINPLDLELERARRYEHCLSLIVIRPDDIDAIATRYGELGSAEVLGEVAEAVARNLRAMDRARLDDPLGYVVLLPETQRQGARVVAERIRLDVGQRRLDFGPGELVNLSVTIGVATFPDDALTNDELIAAARRAFGAGLELGGNRTVLASVPEGSPRGWAIDRDRGLDVPAP